GNAEKQFDILKNDFGWNHLPFSSLENNTVFLYFTALCRNLYTIVLGSLSNRFKSLEPTYRIKKFIFHFIAVPAKWVRHSGQWCLRLYSGVP
ncbi:IS1380 family transposase, partial [Flavivirga aquimarina]|nr:IS1380 family transposase [Flavivirga aquimarina]